MGRVKTSRTLSDSLREVSRAITFEALLGGEPLRHDRNAVRVAKRLVLAEARRLEAQAQHNPRRARSASCVGRVGQGLARGAGRCDRSYGVQGDGGAG